jgi:hypothetical protein
MPNIQQGIYEHYKGNKYEVISIGIHTETREKIVIYKALYKGDFPEGTLWLRPLSMFKEDVLVEGKLAPRFRFLS